MSEVGPQFQLLNLQGAASPGPAESATRVPDKSWSTAILVRMSL